MKIGVIGANGNLGCKLVKQAIERGIEVKGFVYDNDDRYINKSLFDLSKSDIEDIDVLISAFGSGFKVDPIVNKDAFIKYIELLENSNKKLITIAGAGSLYCDRSHTLYEYQSDSHPPKLKDISKNIRLGINEIERNKSFSWVVVCPSRVFDLNGEYTKDYLVGVDNEIIYNEDDNSYVSYDDLACAMLDVASNDLYNHQVITIASRKGGK